MQITIPGVPDKLTYCVMTAIVVDILGATLLAGTGAVLAGSVALILSGASFWLVYRNLGMDQARVATASAVIAAVQIALAILALALASAPGFLTNALVAACLGYVYLQCREPAVG